MSSELNVFIATLPRSGSTLLGMMLGNHSNIFHIGESSYWSKTSPQNLVCSCGNKSCDILMDIHEKVNTLTNVKAIFEVCKIIDKIEEPEKVYHALSLPDKDDIGTVTEKEIVEKLECSCIGLEEIADSFRDIVNKKIIVDNTKNIRIAEHLIEKDLWKVIIMTRDPRGIANSSKNAGIRKNVPRPVKMKIPVFINFAQRAVLLSKMDNVLLLRYEDLCANPEKKLLEICAFIGVEYEDHMLKFKSDKGHTLMGNRMRFDDNEDIVEDLSWVTGLNNSEQLLICGNNRITQLYRQLGYCL